MFASRMMIMDDVFQFSLHDRLQEKRLIIINTLFLLTIHCASIKALF